MKYYLDSSFGDYSSESSSASIGFKRSDKIKDSIFLILTQNYFILNRDQSMTSDSDGVREDLNESRDSYENIEKDKLKLAARKED
jgi:hypothetical protein